MKTSEFIKYFEDKGHRVFRNDFFLSVVDEKDFIFIDIRHGINLDVDYSSTDLTFSERQEYYKVIFEYLMTPIEEREEEKNYYLKQKGVEDNHAFLNYNRFDDRYFTNNKKEHGQYITQFTQSEIDNLPEYYKHPAVWEQIEVESEK